MNLSHLRAFCWLRWRLFVNQLAKGGLANKVLLAILAVMAVGGSVVFFIGFFAIGLLVFALPDVPPSILMFAWDGLAVSFLFFWSVGLMTELQRSEAFSLDKFLHLPVSPSGAFVFNYLSSLMSVNLLIFMPAMVGFALGLAFSKGPAMLLLLFLVAAFFLMVTALTYQFQGWLATLMVNKRRRRTIIGIVTVVFLLVTQAPNAARTFTSGPGTSSNSTVNCRPRSKRS